MLYLCIHDYIQALKDVEDKTETLKIIDMIAQKLGFDYYSYGYKESLPIGQPQLKLINSYPTEWVDIYTRNDCHLIDPTVIHGLKTTMPLIWDLSYKPDHNEFWREACSFGIQHGWSQSVQTQSGVAMLTFSRGKEPITHQELENKTPLLMWAVQAVNEKLSILFDLPNKQIDSVELTCREREVLRWTAEGKTSGETSIILGITERTVTFHLTNAMKKLNATNKISASVKAILFGLI